MATYAPITGAQTRAPSNIVGLPTAASRKVQQPTARRCRIAVEAGAATRLPVQRQSGVQRRQTEDAEMFSALTRTPELLLIMALLHVADDRARARVLGTCVGAKIRWPDCLATRQALAIARLISSGRA